MANYVTLRPDQHKDAGYAPLKSFQFAAEMSVVPILKDEVANAMAQMCLAFRKSALGEGTCFDLVALQSLSGNKNFFILPNGRWLRGYIPAFYRAQPFALKQGDSADKLQLCIDSDSIIDAPGNEDKCFFDDDLELTPHLKNVVTFLFETLKNKQKTLNLCEQLDEAKLIVEWPIQFSEADDNNQPQKKTMHGLYHVDAQALNQLNAEQLASLNHSGALNLAYAQLLSEARLKDLLQLQTAYRQMELNNDKQTQLNDVADLDELFGEKDDLFSF